ncbi:hypothetical protein GYMLUDRAFT_248024 [Collybiopsis luxurians FD-317 M1]|uniref:Uncharacterized protein n=1 Tax=Collybiopsis luxurians FD-317 M1 TaxID=944289 RepID=A0A0D0CDY4_9AGAR|nr:hypothetical protein GYMLUDRAFT_248024 [Collybiopsis luxurians FD-317 M1]
MVKGPDAGGTAHTGEFVNTTVDAIGATVLAVISGAGRVAFLAAAGKTIAQL